MEMPFVALQAEERLILNQEIICYCPVRIVANGAVILNRSMTKDEWPLVTSMAVKTQIVGALAGVQFTMRIMAIAAGHLAFLDRMMGREVGLSLLLLVTGVAKLWVFLLESRFATTVDRVTVVTANVAQGVFAVSPVHQLAVGVTLGTNRCGFFGQKLTKFENLVAVRVDMQAAATMAGFAPFGAAHVLESGQTRVNSCTHTFVTLHADLLAY